MTQPDEPSAPAPDADESKTDEVKAPASEHGRAGRNLPAAIGVGVALGAYVVLSLAFFKPAFALLVAVALCLGAIEISNALKRIGMYAAIVPIIAGTIAIVFGSYFAGLNTWAPIPSNSFLLAALAATVLAALIWRMPKGAEGYVKDSAASLFVIAYVPLLGSFVALLLAGERGVMRMVATILVVVLSDLGGYIVGVFLGKHPMAPKISPKKSWEGLAGSVVFGIVGAMLITVFGLKAPWWVGIILGVAVVLVGVCGDLIESLIKRDVGIKDMSSFLPGHGGVMDRLDSLLVAAPVAWFVMYMLVPGG